MTGKIQGKSVSMSDAGVFESEDAELAAALNARRDEFVSFAEDPRPLESLFAAAMFAFGGEYLDPPADEEADDSFDEHFQGEENEEPPTETLLEHGGPEETTDGPPVDNGV